MLAIASVVVPAVFTTRVQAVFVVPKLAALWGLLAVALGVVAVQALSGRPPPSVRLVPIVDGAVFSFVVLTTLASVFSTDGGQSLYGERLQHQGLLTTALYVAWFYVARAATFTADALRSLLAAAVAGGVLVAAYALAQKGGLDPVWHGFLPGGRVFSSIGQANALAAYLVLVVPLAASFAFSARSVVKVGSFVATAALFLALVFTQSRGGLLGLLAAIAVLAVGWRRDLRLGRRALAWVAVAVIAVVAAFSATGGPRRVVSATDASARFHLDAWRVAVEIAKDNPALGTGPETFPDVLPRYSHDVLSAESASALDAYRVESPHNVYLGIAAGSGIPALVAYLVALGGFAAVIVRSLSTARRETRLVLVAVLGGVVGHVVTDAFMSPEVTSTWLAWILLGASLGAFAAERADPADSRALPK